MHRVLVIPNETYPAHQSFMDEVLSKEKSRYSSVFLMRARDYQSNTTYWNHSKVYLLPLSSKSKILKLISSFFIIDLRYIKSMYNIISKENINVIHVRDLTFPLFVSLIFKLLYKVKVIYQKSFPMEYSRLEIAKNSKRRFSSIIVVNRRIESHILHKLMKFCDAIVPISPLMAENLHRDHRIPQSKMRPFGMGFNFEHSIQPQVSSTVPTEFKIIYIGTLGIYRQFDILIKAIAILVHDLNMHNVHFEFVGGLDKEIADLSAQAEALNISKYITFAGYIQREEVYGKINQSHIGISWFGDAPQFVDASPTKMFEYLSMGVPFIGVDTVVMHKDFIERTRAGALCKVEANDAARQLAEIMNDYPTYKANAVSSIEMIKSNHSYTQMREDYKQLLDGI